MLVLTYGSHTAIGQLLLWVLFPLQCHVLFGIRVPTEVARYRVVLLRRSDILLYDTSGRSPFGDCNWSGWTPPAPQAIALSYKNQPRLPRVGVFLCLLVSRQVEVSIARSGGDPARGATYGAAFLWNFEALDNDFLPSSITLYLMDFRSDKRNAIAVSAHHSIFSGGRGLV